MPLSSAPLSEEDPEHLSRRAAFVHDLAASLRAGLTMHEAIGTSVVGAAPGVEGAGASSLYLDLAHAARRLRPLLGRDGDVVELVASVHARLGGDLPALLDVIAERIDVRVDDLRSARAHAAGALASARTIAFLPAGGVVLSVALGGRPGGPDLLFVLAGIVLGVAGFRWLRRLLPRPPRADASAMIPVLVRTSLAAGITLRTAFDLVAETIPDPDLDRARRAVRLGLSWTDALLRSRSGTLAGLGGAVDRGVTLGLPVDECLDRYVRATELAARREYEEALRRAPVRMILPLTLCVLPGFVLATLGPLLRSILSAS